jgi:hypothetical protein
MVYIYIKICTRIFYTYFMHATAGILHVLTLSNLKSNSKISLRVQTARETSISKRRKYGREMASQI